jgi:hypothetical protein
MRDDWVETRDAREKVVFRDGFIKRQSWSDVFYREFNWIFMCILFGHAIF